MAEAGGYAAARAGARAAAAATAGAGAAAAGAAAAGAAAATARAGAAVATAAAAAPLSVSDALQQVRQSLENITLSIIGEVSELSDRPGYKAVYFTLADESAALSCLVWNNVYARLGIKLQRGMLVEVRGRFSLYAPKGRMNFVVTQISLAGEGALRQRVAELARKLEAEGLMRPERRLPLPVLPRRIGLVTSPRGKAVHDVLRTLRRRYPLAEVCLAGVTVEGAGAAQAMIAGLRAVAEAGAELVLLVRGGGSYEDLMPFNDEALARAIAASPIPVVTGIGHEPDNSIADMVAALRASTPTAAAEGVAPDCEELRAWLRAFRQRLDRDAQARLQRAAAGVTALAGRPVLRSPEYYYISLATALEQSAMRLHQVLPQALRDDCRQLADARAALLRGGLALVERRRATVAPLAARLRGAPRALEAARGALTVAAAQLEGLSPLAVLARGYAAVYDGSGKVLSTTRAAQPGDALRVRLRDGVLGCTVDTVEEVLGAAG